MEGVPIGMTKQNDFRKAGMVSIWIGSIPSEIELDDYMNLSREFERDFQFELHENDMPETTVESEPVPVDQLVNGFSWSSSYADCVTAAAREQGILRATTMVTFFNLEYRCVLPDEGEEEHEDEAGGARLKFLGTFRFF